MSHELRTPLNSSLILAKLLADNPVRNLTEEQVQFARSIESSGNDLLNLINDILDLSKIEAGHIEVRAETVSLSRLAGDLRQTFDPVAGERKLDFAIDIAPDCPSSVVGRPTSGADPEKPALERPQVHRKGRCERARRDRAAGSLPSP